MLRASDEPDSPWKLVTCKTYQSWADAPACITITFEDGTVNRTGSDGGSGYWISTSGWSVRFVA